jgi:rRNA-processing protein EBP2
MTFYNHALQAVSIGRQRFAELRIPFNRPDDYFCESLKSDAHMARVDFPFIPL